MHPELKEITQDIVQQLHAEIWMLLRLTLKPDLDKAIKNILNRKHFKNKFHLLYSDWTLEKLTNLETEKLKLMNLVETHTEIIDGYFKMYVYGVANKYTWYIIRSQQYKKEFIPLRQQEKFKYMMRNRKDPYNI